MMLCSSNTFAIWHLKEVGGEHQAPAVLHSGKNLHLFYWRLVWLRGPTARHEIPRPTGVRFQDLDVIPTTRRIL